MNRFEIARPLPLPSACRSAVSLGASVALLVAAVAPAGAAGFRGEPAALLLDGVALDGVRVEGGGWRPSLVVDPETGAKQLGEPVVDGLTLSVPIAAAGPALLAWLSDFVADGAAPRDFEILRDAGDGRLAATPFYDAHITEVSFPSIDAAGKEPAEIRVAIVAGDRGLARVVDGPLPAAGKTSVPAAFRFEIGGLPVDEGGSIDGFTLRRAGADGAGRVEVPNLKITFSAADAEPWNDWFESFVVRGNCSDGDELDGAITILGPDHEKELFRLDLQGIGLLGLAPVDAQGDRLEAVVYVEEAGAVALESLAIAHEGFEPGR